MSTFREILIDLSTKRMRNRDEFETIQDIEWCLASILERLANWEDFRQQGAPNNDP